MTRWDRLPPPHQLLYTYHLGLTQLTTLRMLEMLEK